MDDNQLYCHESPYSELEESLLKERSYAPEFILYNTALCNPWWMHIFSETVKTLMDDSGRVAFIVPEIDELSDIELPRIRVVSKHAVCRRGKHSRLTAFFVMAMQYCVATQFDDWDINFCNFDPVIHLASFPQISRNMRTFEWIFGHAPFHKHPTGFAPDGENIYLTARSLLIRTGYFLFACKFFSEVIYCHKITV